MGGSPRNTSPPAEPEPRRPTRPPPAPSRSSRSARCCGRAASAAWAAARRRWTSTRRSPGCSRRHSHRRTTPGSPRRCASWSSRATRGVAVRASSRSTSRRRWSARWPNWIREHRPNRPHERRQVGYKRAMKDARRFQLDELTIRPGTYFNPQTEVLIVVDDSPEVDHEIFDMEEFEGTDWVLISEDSPLDEDKRDELIVQFRVTYQPGGELL